MFQLKEVFSSPFSNEKKKWIAGLAIAMAAVVGGALAFEHIGGYIPCALCLEQRNPYYFAVPLMLVAWVLSVFRLPSILPRLLVLICGIAMIYGLGLAIYHSGVEWAFWPGPEGCSAVADGLSGNVNDLLGDLNAKRPPSCDKAALRVLGLSFAGWNAIASAILAYFTLKLGLKK